MRLISLDTQDHTTVVLPIQNILHAVVVEFDPVEGFVYWTDQDLHLIKRARLNGSGELIELCAWSNINIVRSMTVLLKSDKVEFVVVLSSRQFFYNTKHGLLVQESLQS